MRWALWSAALLACNGSARDVSTQCSTGPAYTSTDLPFVTDQAATVNLPACIPRCGSTRSIEGFNSIDALPSGACHEDDDCVIGAQELCPVPSVAGPVTQFECRCSNGQWTCLIAARGARACVSGSAPDAGH